MIWFILYILTVIISCIMLYLSLFRTFDKNGNKIKYELYVYVISIMCLPVPLFNICLATIMFPNTDRYVVKSILFKKY